MRCVPHANNALQFALAAAALRRRYIRPSMRFVPPITRFPPSGLCSIDRSIEETDRQTVRCGAVQTCSGYLKRVVTAGGGRPRRHHEAQECEELAAAGRGRRRGRGAVSAVCCGEGPRLVPLPLYSRSLQGLHHHPRLRVRRSSSSHAAAHGRLHDAHVVVATCCCEGAVEARRRRRPVALAYSWPWASQQALGARAAAVIRLLLLPRPPRLRPVVWLRTHMVSC